MSLKTWSDDREGIRPWLERLYEQHGSVGAMAMALGINRVTVYDWERHPEKISIRYLRRFLRNGLITPEEIMKIIEPKGGNNDIQK